MKGRKKSFKPHSPCSSKITTELSRRQNYNLCRAEPSVPPKVSMLPTVVSCPPYTMATAGGPLREGGTPVLPTGEKQSELLSTASQKSIHL